MRRRNFDRPRRAAAAQEAGVVIGRAERRAIRRVAVIRWPTVRARVHGRQGAELSCRVGAPAEDPAIRGARACVPVSCRDLHHATWYTDAMGSSRLAAPAPPELTPVVAPPAVRLGVLAHRARHAEPCGNGCELHIRGTQTVAGE